MKGHWFFLFINKYELLIYLFIHLRQGALCDYGCCKKMETIFTWSSFHHTHRPPKPQGVDDASGTNVGTTDVPRVSHGL